MWVVPRIELDGHLYHGYGSELWTDCGVSEYSYLGGCRPRKEVGRQAVERGGGEVRAPNVRSGEGVFLAGGATSIIRITSAASFHLFVRSLQGEVGIAAVVFSMA